jgi:hypothetical protein
MYLSILEENRPEDGSIQECSKATKRKQKVQKGKKERGRKTENLKLKLHMTDFAGQLSHSRQHREASLRV